MLPNGASFVSLRAVRTYFVLPKRTKAPVPAIPAIFPRLRFSLGGGRGVRLLFWLEKYANEPLLGEMGEMGESWENGGRWCC